jgi:hypothetical protein
MGEVLEEVPKVFKVPKMPKVRGSEQIKPVA